MKPYLISLAMVAAVAPLAARPAPSSFEQLSAEIIDGASASLALQGWCADHHLPALAAQRVRGADKAPSRLVRTSLAARPGERVLYRRVSLACGPVVVSEADNWYIPGRLTGAMNRQLDETDAPFGLVVRALGFHRETLMARRRPGAGHVLDVRAVLIDAAGTPFSYVVEDYTNELAAPSNR